MPELLFIIILVICLGSAVGALMLIYQMTRDYQSEFLNQFLYYLAAYFIFGLYGLWGQLIVRHVLEHLNIAVHVIETVGGLLPLLSFPFVLVTWVMLIKLAFGIGGKNITPVQSLGYFFGTTAVLAIIGWSLSSQVEFTRIEFLLYVGGELFFCGFFLLISLTSIKKAANANLGHIYRTFSLLVFIALILRLVLLPFIFTNLLILGGALLLYFLGNLLPLGFIYSHADRLFPSYTTKLTDEENFKDLCTQHKISKREAEIMLLICQGKTNKEIADALFIGLQTVKDHNHRIYTKIGIRSRVQLINLIK